MCNFTFIQRLLDKNVLYVHVHVQSCSMKSSLVAQVSLRLPSFRSLVLVGLWQRNARRVLE